LGQFWCFSGRVRRLHYVLLGVEAAPWGWFLGIGFGSSGLGAVIGIVFVLLFLSCSSFEGLWRAATIWFILCPLFLFLGWCAEDSSWSAGTLDAAAALLYCAGDGRGSPGGSLGDLSADYAAFRWCQEVWVILSFEYDKYLCIYNFGGAHDFQFSFQELETSALSKRAL
jgi:hypothetical protein